jgi:hypothetical protein
MNRFFGMMPRNEIEAEKHYMDCSGYSITIQAGSHGWAIIYADASSEYKDIDAATDQNFNDAYNVATKRLGKLKETKSK